MTTTNSVRKYAAEQGIAEEEALKQGMEEKSKEFVEKGAEVESFILELGAGFAFLERQKRMQVDALDYYLDLLFYHRKLRRLVAIDLKIGEFEAADKGQMELYLNWLKRHACEPGEAEPLGMILCAGKNEEHIELLELAKSGIHVATFWTKLLPKRVLERKLHEAVRLARARFAGKTEATPKIRSKTLR